MIPIKSWGGISAPSKYNPPSWVTWPSKNPTEESLFSAFLASLVAISINSFTSLFAK